MKPSEENGFFRAAIAAPDLRVGDVNHNVNAISECLEEADQSGTRLAVFPELCITGYTCGDLFHSRVLLETALDGLIRLAEITAYEPVAALVGLPIEANGRVFNAAAFINGGDVIGIVPKTYLPNTNEFYENRWFSSAAQLDVDHLQFGTEKIPFGTDLLFKYRNLKNCIIGVEICEDLWTVEPPSGQAALAGASILANLSASNELIGKAAYRKELVKQQSARCVAAYLYSASGPGESSTDLVYSGHGVAAENGILLAEQARFKQESTLTLVDIDLDRLVHERLENTCFKTNNSRNEYRIISYRIPEGDKPTYFPDNELNRPLSAHPFVPSDKDERCERCLEIFSLQTSALIKRLRHTNSQSLIIGISGGIDSTLALLVAVEAFERLNFDRKRIIAISMPGPGSTERTQNNAADLAKQLGVTLKTIPIHESVKLHLKDIGHPEGQHDITYENAQARERTQILMDVANQQSGFVLGTGDLSEAALGWCTFNGDHMSMYHVNIGVPKTLVRYLVQWCVDTKFSGNDSKTLQDICDTPVTPELLPPDKDDCISQKTEDHIGPYELNDFILFHTVRYPYKPSKILYLASMAFGKRYTRDNILDAMKQFYTRFFANQFKRSAMPDGPKIGSVALSPRGDWRMPSDAVPQAWLNEIELLRRKKD